MFDVIASYAIVRDSCWAAPTGRFHARSKPRLLMACSRQLICPLHTHAPRPGAVRLTTGVPSSPSAQRTSCVCGRLVRQPTHVRSGAAVSAIANTAFLVLWCFLDLGCCLGSRFGFTRLRLLPLVRTHDRPIRTVPFQFAGLGVLDPLAFGIILRVAGIDRLALAADVDPNSRQTSREAGVLTLLADRQ